MQDRQLYAQILGIESPWRVDRVGLAREQQEVHIYLEHKAGVAWRRRQCGRECALDHQPKRRWRHLATCQYRTILPAAAPRGDCPEHGAPTVKLPWAGPSSRFTALFERLAIDWLRAAFATSRTSLPPSTSTAAAWSWPREPLKTRNSPIWKPSVQNSGRAGNGYRQHEVDISTRWPLTVS